MADPSQNEDFEAFTARIKNNIAEQFRQFRLTQARSLRESAELVDGPRKDLLLLMADDWEKAANTN